MTAPASIPWSLRQYHGLASGLLLGAPQTKKGKSEDRVGYVVRLLTDEWPHLRPDDAERLVRWVASKERS